ncbi:MAG: hypothetical protein EHM70_06280 [Chloroflexota bacterium]|nr:MAG: hypothetical protein EHM70_06280 [Chloroflexota bacterium]
MRQKLRVLQRTVYGLIFAELYNGVPDGLAHVVVGLIGRVFPSDAFAPQPIRTKDILRLFELYGGEIFTSTLGNSHAF